MFILDGQPLSFPEPAYSRANINDRFYNTGKPCKNGHLSNRYKCNNECVQCRANKNIALKERQAKWAVDNKERRNLLSKRRYYANQEAEQERTRQKYAKDPKRVNATNKAWRDKNPKMGNYYAAARRASLRQRTPAWADLEAIKQFYLNCPDGYHVDHIIPLRGKTVCGFHVLNNLQYLPASENMRKFNRLEAQYVYA